MMRSAPFLALLSAACTGLVEAQVGYKIAENAYQSYFEIEGNVEDSFKPGAKVSINGKDNEVMLSQFMTSTGNTFVQLENNHEAAIGDLVDLHAEADIDSRTTTTTTPRLGKPAVSAVETTDFKDLPFLKAVDVLAAKEEVQSTGKPAVVFVTQPWCGACKGLKANIMSKEGDKVREHMEHQFVTVHAEADAGNQWQAKGANDGYIPRVYFLDNKGDMLDIKGPNPEYSHFFMDTDSLLKAMNTALSESGKLGKHAVDEL